MDERYVYKTIVISLDLKNKYLKFSEKSETL